MGRNLLIVGAGIYSVIAREIAEDMNCFDKIGFVDEVVKTTPDGIEVVGTFSDIASLSSEYSDIIVAIGNPEIRSKMIEKIESEYSYNIVSLISPKAYVSPLAKIEKGCFVEPMAVIHSGSEISTGCIISAGAIINHMCSCSEYTHIDCGAIVTAFATVPPKRKIPSGIVFTKDSEALFF